MREQLGNSHDATVTSFLELASVLTEQDKLAEAQELFREAMEILQFDLSSPLVENWDLTANLLAEMLQARRERLWKLHPDTLKAVFSLASWLHVNDKLDEAEPLYREALAGRQAVLGKSHPDT